MTSAHATGSDIVVGSVERFDAEGLVADLGGERPRRAAARHQRWWTSCPCCATSTPGTRSSAATSGSPRTCGSAKGVAYEDQPIISQLFARAASIDVLTDIVYLYRARDDNSSISQQTATLADLRDRIEAWQVSRDLLRREASEPVYEGWLATLFEAHFHWYLTSGGTVDDTYWDELRSAVCDFADGAAEWVWLATTPPKRVLIRLVQPGQAGRRPGVRAPSVPHAGEVAGDGGGGRGTRCTSLPGRRRAGQRPFPAPPPAAPELTRCGEPAWSERRTGPGLLDLRVGLSRQDRPSRPWVDDHHGVPRGDSGASALRRHERPEAAFPHRRGHLV